MKIFVVKFSIGASVKLLDSNMIFHPECEQNNIKYQVINQH